MFNEVDSIDDKGFLEEFEAAPNNFASYNILHGLNKGKFYLSASKKAAIIIENSNYPYVFIAGEANENDLKNILEIYPDEGILYCNQKYHSWFIKHGFKIYFRIKFKYIEPIELSINKELIIKSLDNHEILKRCQKYNSILRRYGSIENFLKIGIGYALCNQNEEIISEVYSAYVLPNQHEISIFTHEKYRSIGAASQICSYFAQQCIKMNMTPAWMCNSDNIGSIRTALKIGFEIERYYPQLIKQELVFL